MRVNFAFNGFFANRLVTGSGIAMLMLTIFFIASSFKENSDHDLAAKQMNLIIRQIGHRLLLQAGDSTSRVLPVTEIKKGTFLLRFENKFVFNHDSLTVLSQSLLPKTQFPSGYTVTVQDCLNGDIVYGFQLSNTSPDILACRGRSQPPGCYTIEFSFPGFYENAKRQKADTGQSAVSAQIDPQKVNPAPEELTATTSGYGIDQRTEELKSIKAGARVVNPKTEEIKTTAFSYPLINVVYGGMLLFGVTLLIGRFGKILNPVSVQQQDEAIIKPDVPGLPSLGQFLYNVREQRLLLGSEVIDLTDKESKVLELLHKNFGELISRETLMQEIWINEGVITGRSLDMFISKLRKKLGADPDLRITNIHGKGYRLETTNDFIA